MEKTKIMPPVAQLPVLDVETAQAYYRDVLGFDVIWLTPDKYIGAVERDDIPIFFARTDRPFEPNIHWIYAPDVEQTYREFKDRGADITDPLETKPWDIRQFTVRDLNGHIFYVHG